MTAYVVRVWLPDRPGALGAVASRIGAVRGEIVGIDILERGAGKAIDELVVDLQDDTLLPLLLREMAQVDGVDVEEVREVRGAAHDPRLDALESAVVLVEAATADEVLTALAKHACRDFEAEWAVVFDHRSPVPLAVVGSPPDTPWLAAFVAGSRSSVHASSGEAGPDDVAWADLASADLTLVLGRSGRPFRSRERRQATVLARIADARWMERALANGPR